MSTSPELNEDDRYLLAAALVLFFRQLRQVLLSQVLTAR